MKMKSFVYPKTHECERPPIVLKITKETMDENKALPEVPESTGIESLVPLPIPEVAIENLKQNTDADVSVTVPVVAPDPLAQKPAIHETDAGSTPKDEACVSASTNVSRTKDVPSLPVQTIDNTVNDDCMSAVGKNDVTVKLEVPEMTAISEMEILTPDFLYNEIRFRTRRNEQTGELLKMVPMSSRSVKAVLPANSIPQDSTIRPIEDTQQDSTIRPAEVMFI